MQEQNTIIADGNTSGVVGSGKKNALVALLGRPSAGKSTFLNTACQEPVSIVSPIPQTTRNAVRGIVNTSFGQLVFVDTPGYHDSDKKLNLRLRALTEDALEGADAVLYIMDSTRPAGQEEMLTATLAARYESRLVAAINKIDAKGADAQGARSFLRSVFPALSDDRILEMSALKDDGINEVLKALYALSPEQPPLYEEDLYTDQSIEFRAAEVIRGEAVNRLSDEIPHCLYVKVADLEKRSETKLWVRAFLCVERESQKGIAIGKNAAMIKEIRTAAERALNGIFPYKVQLDLQVKVDKNWRQRDSVLNKIIPN
ncbi:MAG: GTPase Era [Treponema sp.]